MHHKADALCYEQTIKNKCFCLNNGIAYKAIRKMYEQNPLLYASDQGCDLTGCDIVILLYEVAVGLQHTFL